MGNARSCGAPPLADPDLGIWFDGRSFHYQHYRYERLADAVAFARADQRRPDYRPVPLPLSWEQWTAPSGEECEIMATYGIVYEHGTYRYKEFHYDFLEQALAYARRELMSPSSRPGKGAP